MLQTMVEMRKRGNNMHRVFRFGKIDYEKEGVKNNLVTVEVEFKNRNIDFKEVFAVSGNIWNSRESDIIVGGQCLDEILKYVQDDTFKRIHRLWKKYHLNDMNAGTVEQENALKEAVKNGILTSYGANNYEKSCEYLASVGLYEVEYEGKPYKYGHGWLYRAIPEEDLQVIRYLLTQ